MPAADYAAAGTGTTRATALARFSRRPFGSLTSEEAQAVLQVRPDPVATVRRSGRNPYRILCFGGGALGGPGLDDHRDGLPGRIADQVVQQTGRGAQVDVVVAPDPSDATALTLLRGLRLRRFDVVVVMLGDPTSEHPSPDRWRGALVGLLKLLQTETSAAAGLFVYDTARAMIGAGLQPASARDDRRARFFDVTEEVCGLSQRVRFAELTLVVGGRTATNRLPDSTCDDWAEQIVRRMKPVFEALARAEPSASPRFYRNRAQDERFRQRAVDALRLRRGERDALLDRELTLARSRYRTSTAALTILDRDLQWSKACSDALIETPRSIAFCDFAIRSDELTLINDTWLDPRTRSNPRAQGPDAIRFYAGFPVHSLDGYRIGMVCVFGETPKSFRPSDLEYLRDTAGRVEQLLWEGFLRAGR
jgi:GAF domain-containing protein